MRQSRNSSRHAFEKLVQCLKNKQFWGNAALILIQVALLVLFQLVEYYDKKDDGCLAIDGFLVIGAFVFLLVVGVVLYAATTKVKFATAIIVYAGFALTIIFLVSGRPENGEKGIGWIMTLALIQTVNLGISWWASTKIKRTPEDNSGSVENTQRETQLTRRAWIYSWINLIVSFLGASIATVPLLRIFHIISHTCPIGGAELYGNVFMAVISLAGFVMFLSRFIWMRKARTYGYQVTDSPDDYSLERTTLLAWLLLLLVLTVQYCTGKNIGDLGLGTVGGWIIALAFWTPLVSIVGSSWGKLKAISPNGEKAVWPCRWSDVKE